MILASRKRQRPELALEVFFQTCAHKTAAQTFYMVRGRTSLPRGTHHAVSDERRRPCRLVWRTAGGHSGRGASAVRWPPLDGRHGQFHAADALRHASANERVAAEYAAGPTAPGPGAVAGPSAAI